MTLLRRMAVSTADLSDYLADGWRVVFALPMPMRGTDWLIEWRAV